MRQRRRRGGGSAASGNRRFSTGRPAGGYRVVEMGRRIMVHVIQARCPRTKQPFTIALPAGHAPQAEEVYQVTSPTGSTLRLIPSRLHWQLVRKEEADTARVVMARP